MSTKFAKIIRFLHEKPGKVTRFAGLLTLKFVTAVSL
jgi:hypothetical protein